MDRLGLASRSFADRCLYSKDTRPTLQASKSAPPAAGLGLAIGPNPFNPSTQIAFRLQAPTPVEARIYDAGGHVMATLAHGTLPAGPHRITWDGRTRHGAAAPSGIYFLHLRVGAESHRAKLVLAK
jgi:hypothetical protein